MGFFTQIFRKKQSKVCLGVSENAEEMCCVINEEGRISTDYAKKSDIPLKDFVLQAVKNTVSFANAPIVRAVNPAFIWRKTLLLPAHYNQNKIYRQIIQHLTQEMPIPIQAINFDYQILALPDNIGWQVNIYALTKEATNQLIFDKQTYLDCEYLCIQRAFHFLANRTIQNIFNIGYLTEDTLLQFKQNGIIIGDFTLHNELSQIYSYKDITETQAEIIKIELEDNYSPKLYLSALGASLWQM